MAELNVILNDLDIKALSYDCYDPEDWVENCKSELGERSADAILKKIAKNKNRIVKDFIDGIITADIDTAELPIGVSFTNFEAVTISNIVDKAVFDTAKEKTDNINNK